VSRGGTAGSIQAGCCAGGVVEEQSNEPNHERVVRRKEGPSRFLSTSWRRAVRGSLGDAEHVGWHPPVRQTLSSIKTCGSRLRGWAGL
jgi:hypothetical protein